MNLPKLIVILGQTATGKTELAIKLAKRLGGEIVSADSRQIYKGMNIGTAKPTKKELKKIPYYLIDIVRPNEAFNVALYKKLATEKIINIQKKGKLPFLVGGTGLYISSITDNISFPVVAPDKKLRMKLEKKTALEIFEIYKKLDPEGSKFIDKKNKRRLIRAIEVCKKTGKSFWQQRKKQKPIFDVLEIGIKIKKEELKKRIEKRIEKMISLGLKKEAKNLYRKYGSLPVFQTIGYQEFKEYFEKKINEEKTKELIELHTFQFTKRQMTWFKQNPAPEQARYGASKKIRWIKNQKEAEKLIKKFLRQKKSQL